MSADRIRSLVKGITQLTQRGISSISQILSTTTEDGVTGPVGEYPDCGSTLGTMKTEGVMNEDYDRRMG